MNVETLISLCLGNNRAAQKKLYDNYKDNLYTIAYRMTQDTALSSDILQESFIEAFKSLSTLKEPRYFHSWIKKILIRKAYRMLEKEKTNATLDHPLIPRLESIIKPQRSIKTDSVYIKSMI